MTEIMERPPDLSDVAPIVQRAQSLTIRNQADLDQAASEASAIKTAIKRIVDWFANPKKKADDLHKELCNKERTELAPYKQAEKIYKDTMQSFQARLEAERLAAQRKLQAEADELARRERERIEQAEAKQRAIEAAARAKAEAARLEAEQASAAERKKLLAQAEAAERKAAAAQAKADAKAEEGFAVVAPVVRVEPTAVAPTGTSTRKIWKAKITDLKAFFAYVHEKGRDDLILPNEKTLDALAKALKEQAVIPGVSFYAEQQMAIRS